MYRAQVPDTNEMHHFMSSAFETKQTNAGILTLRMG
jgi:hypothetical protein